MASRLSPGYSNKANEAGLTKVAPTSAAEIFLNIAVGNTSKLAAYSLQIDIDQEEKKLKIGVNIFLHGLLSS
ncbi:MAG: hypothetical protein NT113_11165 [Hyphomicrobiales bacterium]|nr:hypothetical protein [Hyphomicrobiales bacterium]